MKNKLELKHLACYLPYGLDLVMQIYKNGICQGTTKMTLNNVETVLKMVNFDVKSKSKFPILRPLSDLNKEIEEGEAATLDDWIACEYGIVFDSFVNALGVERLPYEVVEYLFEWRFDVFGLIEQNLAIDINTLNPKP